MALSKGDSALMFKALADETRLRIFGMLSDTEVCACDILEHVDITQPTLSHHMKVLAERELINSRKDGTWMRYTLNKDKITELQNFLEDIKNNTPSESGSKCCD